jgi:hypothetical protein
MSLTADSGVDRVGSGAFVEAGGASGEAQFLQPAAGRIVTGVGFDSVHLQQALRHHSSVARRIVLGRQILKIVGKKSQLV